MFKMSAGMLFSGLLIGGLFAMWRLGGESQPMA